MSSGRFSGATTRSGSGGTVVPSLAGAVVAGDAAVVAGPPVSEPGPPPSPSSEEHPASKTSTTTIQSDFGVDTEP